MPPRANNTRNFQLANIASVSRSSGLEKDGDALKNWATQTEYYAFIHNKLDEFWKRFPLHYDAGEESSQQARSRIDAQENIMILLRKLREGISSSRRKDSFVRKVYEESLHLSIVFTNPKQTSSIVPPLLDLYNNTSPPLEITLILIHQLVLSYPSQNLFANSLASMLPPNIRQWVTSLAQSLRRSNWLEFFNCIQPSHYKSLFSQSIELAIRALEMLLAALSKKARETNWKVIRSAYRELSCQDESEGAIWLGNCLGIRKHEQLEQWMDERRTLGEIQAKEGVMGRWIIVKRR